MPIQRRTKRKDPLGKRIFMCDGVVVDSPDINHATNIGRKKVECTCGSIVLRVGYPYHIKRPSCIEYHKLIGKEVDIVQYLP